MDEYEQIAAIYAWPPSEMAELTPRMRRWWAKAAIRKAKRMRSGSGG